MNIKSSKIKSSLLLVLALAFSASSLAGDTEEERNSRQSTLDAACEVAREKKLVVVRAQLVSECVKKKEFPDRASCEQSYASYGARSGNRAALYYDLPQCVKAYNYSTSYRSSDN